MRSLKTAKEWRCRPPRTRLMFVATVGAFLLPLTAHPALIRAQQPMGRVSGAVRDSAGVGLAGARLELATREGGVRIAASDSLGYFRFAPVPAGAARLVVRRIGYFPDTSALNIQDGVPTTLAIRLDVSVQGLAPVIVTERREVYDARLEGFYARQARGIGRFIGRERIVASASSSFTDILRAEVPGIRIGALGNLSKAVRLRGSRCPPLVFLDGFPATAGEFDVDMLELSSLEGIEVYSGLTSVPPEFIGPRMLERCGVIAVWTHPTSQRPRSPRQSADAPKGVSQNLEGLVARGDVLTAADVDVRVSVDSGSFAPAFPDQLHRSGIGGRVTVEFIVDTLGEIEPGSTRIVSSTDSRFDEAVLTALLSAHFSPARLAGRPVRQLERLPVVFGVSGDPADQPAPDSTPRRPPLSS